MKALKIEFALSDNGLKVVERGGDGFIKKIQDTVEVYLYSGSGNIKMAGRIAVGLLCDGELRTSSTAKVFLSHPLQEVNTLEMIACQWVFENRPSDDSVQVLSWLESLGLRDFEARRVHDLFIRFCMWSMFKGIELKFKPPLKTVE